MFPLDELERFDPDLARTAAEAAATLSHEGGEWMVADTLWASAMEPAFGRAVLQGYVNLAAHDAGCVARYHHLLLEIGPQGPAFGRLMAVHLVPVLIRYDRHLMRAFTDTVATMRQNHPALLNCP